MEKKYHSWLIAVIILICFAYAAAGLIYKPIICNDALYGWTSLHNYLQGGGWNEYLRLSPGGVEPLPLTWWAPGQYAIPYFLQKLFFIDIGDALVLLLFFSLATGCVFYYQLFKRSSLKSPLILVALVVIILQRLININFIQYNAADLLLFGYTPLYVYSYCRVMDSSPKPTVPKILLLVALNYLGIYIKNSFILFELAMTVFIGFELVYRGGQQPGDHASLLKRSVILLPAALANLGNYLFFLRFGALPADGAGLSVTALNLAEGLFLPVTEILFGSLSISGLYGNVYDQIHLPEVITGAAILLMLSGLGYSLYRNRTGLIRLYRNDLIFRIASVSAVIYTICWLAFTLKQSAVSNEDRLYLPVTMLIFPFLFHYLVKTSGFHKYLYLGLVFASVVYGVLTFGYRVRKYAMLGTAHSKDQQLNGFRVFSHSPNRTPELERIAGLIRRRYPDSYICLSYPDMAFELNVTNKFVIQTPSPVYRQLAKLKNNCLLLLDLSKDHALPGLTVAYASPHFILYQLQLIPGRY